MAARARCPKVFDPVVVASADMVNVSGELGAAGGADLALVVSFPKHLASEPEPVRWKLGSPLGGVPHDSSLEVLTPLEGGRILTSFNGGRTDHSPASYGQGF